ncbi:hypothetical protein C8Q80DRAFT_1211726 [Daedaleopsis nitida]|nr:hypothetical protein C8Q80DRAFT_1211726 [Daedaleopsis nitida]
MIHTFRVIHPHPHPRIASNQSLAHNTNMQPRAAPARATPTPTSPPSCTKLPLTPVCAAFDVWEAAGEVEVPLPVAVVGDDPFVLVVAGDVLVEGAVVVGAVVVGAAVVGNVVVVVPVSVAEVVEFAVVVLVSLPDPGGESVGSENVVLGPSAPQTEAVSALNDACAAESQLLWMQSATCLPSPQTQFGSVKLSQAPCWLFLIHTCVQSAVCPWTWPTMAPAIKRTPVSKLFVATISVL